MLLVLLSFPLVSEDAAFRQYGCVPALEKSAIHLSFMNLIA